MKKTKEYRLGEDIIKQDGTRVYTVEEIIDYIFGNPITKIVFRGSKEECIVKFEELKREK